MARLSRAEIFDPSEIVAVQEVPLEQHMKTGGLEMFVIGKRLDDSKPTHHNERNLINDSRLARIAR